MKKKEMQQSQKLLHINVHVYLMIIIILYKYECTMWFHCDFEESMQHLTQMQFSASFLSAFQMHWTELNISGEWCFGKFERMGLVAYL